MAALSKKRSAPSSPKPPQPLQVTAYGVVPEVAHDTRDLPRLSVVWQPPQIAPLLQRDGLTKGAYLVSFKDGDHDGMALMKRYGEIGWARLSNTWYGFLKNTEGVRAVAMIMLLRAREYFVENETAEYIEQRLHGVGERDICAYFEMKAVCGVRVLCNDQQQESESEMRAVADMVRPHFKRATTSTFRPQMAKLWKLAQRYEHMVPPIV
jgi:hypothetical protein